MRAPESAGDRKQPSHSNGYQRILRGDRFLAGGLDHLPNCVDNEFRLVEVHKVAAVVREELAVTGGEFCEIRLEFEPHLAELGWVDVRWHVWPPSRAGGGQHGQWQIVERTGAPDLCARVFERGTFVDHRLEVMCLHPSHAEQGMDPRLYGCFLSRKQWRDGVEQKEEPWETDCRHAAQDRKHELAWRDEFAKLFLLEWRSCPTSTRTIPTTSFGWAWRKSRAIKPPSE